MIVQLDHGFNVSFHFAGVVDVYPKCAEWNFRPNTVQLEYICLPPFEQSTNTKVNITII